MPESDQPIVQNEAASPDERRLRQLEESLAKTRAKLDKLEKKLAQTQGKRGKLQRKLVQNIIDVTRLRCRLVDLAGAENRIPPERQVTQRTQTPG